MQAAFRSEIADMLRREIKDPRIGFASITGVEISADWKLAKVYVSVLGDDDAKRDTVEGLRSATGYVRGELGRRYRLRLMPEIQFVLDESIERGSRVLALLRQVQTESEQR